MSAIRFGLDELSRRLHEINLLDMPENHTQQIKLVRAFNAELAGSGLQCRWAVEEEVWVVRDTPVKEGGGANEHH